MGVHQEDQTFAVTDADGTAVPVQTWPLAHWPDGSLKWTAHAVSSGNGKLTLTAGTPAAPAREGDRRKRRRHHRRLHRRDHRQDRQERLDDHQVRHPWCHGDRQERPAPPRPAARDRGRGPGHGQDRAVRRSRLRGHRRTGRAGPGRRPRRRQAPQGRPRLAAVLPPPLLLRRLRLLPHGAHRHLRRHPGARQGLRRLRPRPRRPLHRADARRGLRPAHPPRRRGHRPAPRGRTGASPALRRDPGAAVQAAQYEGRKLPDPATWDQRVTTRLGYVPHWGDYTLAQLSADGFTVRKRTKKGYGWIGAGGGEGPPASATSVA